MNTALVGEETVSPQLLCYSIEDSSKIIMTNQNALLEATYHVLSGFVGIEQDASSLSLRPKIAWCAIHIGISSTVKEELNRKD